MKTQEDTLNGTFRRQLRFRPPLDWRQLGRYLAARGAPCAEQFHPPRFVRTVSLDGHDGWVSATPNAAGNALGVTLSESLAPVYPALRPRLRRLFDLGADPARIATHLSAHKRLRPLLKACPGLRMPGALDGFEIVLRAILGQQISVAAATTVYGRFVTRFGRPVSTPFEGLDRSAPDAATLADAGIDSILAMGVMRRRAETIRIAARQIADGHIRLDGTVPTATVIEQLVALPGIGPWTAHYVAMRALGDADMWPRADLGLLKAVGVASARELDAVAVDWSPYRTYAALHLWNSLAMQAGRARGG